MTKKSRSLFSIYCQPAAFSTISFKTFSSFLLSTVARSMSKRLFDPAKLVTRTNEDNLTNSPATQVRHGVTLGHDKNLGHSEFRIKGVH